MSSANVVGPWEALLTVPEQVEAAIADFEASFELLDDDIEDILIVGLDAELFSEDLIAACLQPVLECPVIVHRGVLPPAWVGPKTLLLVVSVAGSSDESLQILSLALQSEASVLAVSAEEELISLVRSHGESVVVLPENVGVDRSSLLPLTGFCLRGLVEVGIGNCLTEYLSEAIEVLHQRRDSIDLRERSEARNLATMIEGSTPVIYGTDSVGLAAAKQWKYAVQNLLQTRAYWAPLQEGITEYLIGKDAAQSYTQIRLSNRYESAATALFPARDLAGDSVVVTANGSSPVARLFDLILLGESMSLELAKTAGINLDS